MSVIGTPSADGTVQVHCPRPGCSAALRVKPKSARTWVTCAADGCGHRFVLEVPGLAPARDAFALKDDDAPPPPPKPTRPRKPAREEEPAGRSGKTVALLAGGAAALLLVGGGLVVGAVYLLRGKDNPAPVAQAQAPVTPAAAPAIPVVAFEPIKADTPVAAKPKIAPAKAAPAPGADETVVLDPTPPATAPDETTPARSQPPKKANPKKGGPVKEVNVTSEAIEKVKKSTALFERKDGWGTGFVIRPGIVMTNFHVIAGAPLDELKVSFVSVDDTAPAGLKPTLLYCNPERDLALLRVDTDRPPLDMCPTGTELTGLDVAIVGNPKGDGGQASINKVTTGTLAAPVRRNAGWTYYELQCEAFFGNSGGPVVDRKTGKVVGIIQSILGDGKSKSYCIPFGEAARALDRLPASKEGEPAATKIATARHALDYFNTQMPIIEDNAVLGMQLQLNVLKYGSGNVSVTLKNGGTMSAAEITQLLKEQHAKTYLRLQKLVDGTISASPEVPSALKSAARTRMEACGSMRSHASSRTDTETAYRKAMDSRTANSDKAARTFIEEYKKFLEKMDAK
jgi:S1-C subfamily serine protease